MLCARQEFRLALKVRCRRDHHPPRKSTRFFATGPRTIAAHSTTATVGGRHHHHPGIGSALNERFFDGKAPSNRMNDLLELLDRGGSMAPHSRRKPVKTIDRAIRRRAPETPPFEWQVPCLAFV